MNVSEQHRLLGLRLSVCTVRWLGLGLIGLWLSSGVEPALAAVSAQGEGRVVNGGFEVDSDGDGVPDGWQTAGRRGVIQSLRQVDDPDRGKVACLTCTQFEPGFPDSHAMLAQVGTVGLRRGQWYRLRLWTRAERLQTGEVQIAVVNRRTWQDTGIRDAFTPSSRWELVEIFAQATADLSPADSRLQIWLSGTGVLYVDDIELQPVEAFRPQRLPQIPWINPRNAIPNSSFECGGTGWGSFAPRLTGWGSHVFFLHGKPDISRAKHGKTSWHLSLDLDQPLVSFFDYFDPRAEVVDCLVVAHEGWIPVTPGERYQLSCWAVAQEENTPVLLQVVQADGRRIERRVSVGTEWTRIALGFTAEREFLWAGVGIDLRGTGRRKAELWIDAVQLARAEGVSTEDVPYEPRQALEAFLSTGVQGNIFRDPAAGLEIVLSASNASAFPKRLEGVLWITDFRDQTVWEHPVDEAIGPHGELRKSWSRLLAGKTGFYRVHFARKDSDETQSIRVALIEPIPEDQDTAFGMNHAFGWAELLALSHVAGVRWWRDWSTQWRLVQGEEGGPLDFSVPEGQMMRVLRAGGRVVMLLPFPGAPWAVDVDEARIRAEAGNNRYLAERLVVAQKPRDSTLFGQYVRAAIAHFWPAVDTAEILNEPLFTSYALPASFGYRMDDYLELLRTAYTQAKAVSPEVRVVGGIAAPPEHRYVREFLEKGGAAWCDVVNLHLYPHRGDPLAYEAAFREHWQLLERSGPKRPVWVTEFGLYADDDPAARPFRVGDATMTRSLRPSELRASIDLVKFAAIMRAYGVEKIFYHAGTCGAWNADSAGNIFFEYGGAPRKMYAAQAVLSRMLPPEARFVRRWEEPGSVVGFEFVHAKSNFRVAILWTTEPPQTFRVPAGWQAVDLMGNPVGDNTFRFTEEPIYLISQPAE